MRFTEYLQENSQKGDCFMVAANLVVDEYYIKRKTNKLLVHGAVIGQGQIAGLEYGHAWVEEGDMVIDKSNGNDIHIPKMIYYALGNIEDKPGKLYRYTAEQTRRKLLESEHYGPWDLNTKL